MGSVPSVPDSPSIVVPVIQIVAIAILLAVHYFCHEPRFVVNYYGPARNLILKENYPLVIAFVPFVYVLEWFSGLPSPIRGTCLMIGTTVFGIALLPSVALFWYFVVIEAEARIRGESRLRFRNSVAESVVIAVMFLAGTAAILYAYTHGAPLIRAGIDMVDGVVGGAFLVIWGMALIGMAVSDLRWLARKVRDG